MTPMTFSSFTSLKYLRIAPIYLYGQDVLQLGDCDGHRIRLPPSQEDIQSTRMVLLNALPRQLEMLYLIHCDDDSTLDRLVVSPSEALAHKEKFFANLREIVIQGMKPAVSKEKLEWAHRMVTSFVYTKVLHNSSELL